SEANPEIPGGPDFLRVRSHPRETIRHLGEGDRREAWRIEAIMTPLSPYSIALTAASPNLRPSIRSKPVGGPRRSRWPSESERVSFPVSLATSAASFSATPL